jgi:pimeloyl-ACP methyl ester carboxylesterase
VASEFTIQNAGATLRGEAWGDGACAIFLHAGVADRRMWRSTLAALSGSHLGVAYDRRGFGETSAPDEVFRHIDDLDCVVRHFGCERPILIGSSQGGRVAIDYALAHPGQVAALILVAPALTGAPMLETYPPEIAGLLAELDAAETEGDLERINAIEAHMWLDGPLSLRNRIAGDIRHLFLDMNGKALRHAPLTLEQPCPSAVERLHSITAPVFVIWGGRDFPHIQQRSQWLANTIPGAQSLIMDGCAHLPNLEQPARFNAAIQAFLARNRG